MRFRSLLFLFALGLYGVQGVAEEGDLPEDAPETATSGLKFYTYRDGMSRFSIELPRMWTVMSHPVAVLLAAAPLNQFTSLFRPNLNVMVSEVAANASLEELVQSNVNFARLVIPQFAIQSIQDVDISGTEAKQMIYSCRLAARSRAFDVKNVAYFVLQSPFFFIITGSSLQQQHECFFPIFQYMGFSFQ